MLPRMQVNLINHGMHWFAAEVLQQPVLLCQRHQHLQENVVAAVSSFAIVISAFASFAGSPDC